MIINIENRQIGTETDRGSRVRPFRPLQAVAFAAAASVLSLGASLVASPVKAEEVAAPETIIVIGQRDRLAKISGTGATIEAADLVRARVLNVNEALRQVAGIYARDEEGMGLRPNIGIRGLSPTRSSKLLLLEDGLPLSYAPYGDNATYYHPPIRRFARIEVLKGASQIRFGPNTVGGVINYVTPEAPDTFEGKVTLAAGDRGYGEFDLSLGGPVAGARAIFHANVTRSQGVRDNLDLQVKDVFLKVQANVGAAHDLTLRISHYDEDSQITYSGLTQSEYLANPRQNPFVNDAFKAGRTGASLLWAWQINDQTVLKTSATLSYFSRDWWRQSSNSAQRPNDASDPSCATMANLLTTCGNEGRLRNYHTYGAESRLSHIAVLGPLDVETEVGVRYADERQSRLQINSDTPTGRTPGTSVNAGVRENNLRYVQAWSGFVVSRISWGKLSLSPGLRVEDIEMQRVNRLNPAAIVAGQDRVHEVIPGLGVTYVLDPNLTLYGGVHKGFAPPRVEDTINNNSGASINLDAETSTSFEAGLRGTPLKGLTVDLAWFSMDFDNQIVPASVAGGNGASLTSAGATLHQGLEFSTRGSLRAMGLVAGNDVFFRSALTWVKDASYRGARFSNITGFGTVKVTGNRLPYAPEWLLTAAIGREMSEGVELQAEYVFTDEMFTDDLNRVEPSANGQTGLIKSHGIWNVTLNVQPPEWPIGLYVTVKNVGDTLAIVDRSRGILPNAPRTFQIGLVQKF